MKIPEKPSGLTHQGVLRRFRGRRWRILAPAALLLLFVLGLATYGGVALLRGQPGNSNDSSMPGMDMSQDGNGSMSGHDMSPVASNGIPSAAANARGNQPLEPMLMDGVKMFSLTVGQIRWSILPTVQVTAYAYNGQVPGPLIRVNAGDRVRIEDQECAPRANLHPLARAGRA